MTIKQQGAGDIKCGNGESTLKEIVWLLALGFPHKNHSYSHTISSEGRSGHVLARPSSPGLQFNVKVNSGFYYTQIYAVNEQRSVVRYAN